MHALVRNQKYCMELSDICSIAFTPTKESFHALFLLNATDKRIQLSSVTSVYLCQLVLSVTIEINFISRAAV